MATAGPNVHRGVLQTRFGAPEGNCYAACMATILGLPLDQVPDYRWPAAVPWFGLNEEPTPEQAAASDALACQWREWLAALCGLTLVRVKWGLAEQAGFEGVITIGTVHSRRGFPHAVVCRGGKVAWDPHPDQDSYDIPCADHELFVAVEPEKALEVLERFRRACGDHQAWQRRYLRDRDEQDREYERRTREGGALGG